MKREPKQHQEAAGLVGLSIRLGTGSLLFQHRREDNRNG